MTQMKLNFGLTLKCVVLLKTWVRNRFKSYSVTEIVFSVISCFCLRLRSCRASLLCLHVTAACCRCDILPCMCWVNQHCQIGPSPLNTAAFHWRRARSFFKLTLSRNLEEILSLHLKTCFSYCCFIPMFYRHSAERHTCSLILKTVLTSIYWREVASLFEIWG